MKRIEKRRMLETLVKLGHFHAPMAHDLASGARDAAADHSPLLPFYARMTWIWNRTFVEMAEVMAGVPTLVGSMDEWGEVIKKEVGQHWNESERNGFDFFLSEYQRAVEAAGGLAPIGLATHTENEEYSVMFDSRDEEDDDEDEG